MSVEKPEITFAVLYRWRLVPGSEAVFKDSWAKVTEQLKTRGGRGSRLHKAEDGTWYAYAQWPSAKAREEAVAEPSDAELGRGMSESIAERFDEIRLEIVADFLD
ncbi:MAG: antibiotic biosynthesis monooxygenase [Armatimonadota bacterium]